MAEPLRIRIAKAIAGKSAKSFVPSLGSDLGWGWDQGGKLKAYTSKPEQLSANIGWVFAANTAIVEPAASVELKLQRVMSNGDREDIESHELLDLLDAPNLVHTGEQQRELHYTYMNLVGEAYEVMLDLNGNPFIPTKGKLPAALHTIPSHEAQLELDKTQFSKSVIKYGQREFPILSVIRDLNASPFNPYFGRSIISAAAAAIDTDEQMKEWNRRFFANNARPSMILTTEGEMDDETYRRFHAEVEGKHTGTDNAFKFMLVEGGAKATPWMMSQTDLDFLDSRKFSKDEILAMFKVSPGMIGMTENVNRSNMDAAFYLHAVLNTVPRVRKYVKQLNASLVKVYDPTLELTFVNPVPEDVEAKLKATQAGVNNWLTIDEARDEYGLDGLPDKLGTTIYLQNNKAPIQKVADGTATPPPVAPQGGNQTPDNNEADDGDVPTGDPNAKAHDGVKKKT